MHVHCALLSRQLCLPNGMARLRHPHRRHPRHTCQASRANSQPSLLEVFSAVSEGRLSPLDAAQTMEEAICNVPQKSVFPKVLNGRGKRAEWIGQRMKELIEQQGHVLATNIAPTDYAEIRKIIPGVVYHAGARTLKVEHTESVRKLPGCVGIVSDESVPLAALDELQILSEYFGCYTFRIHPLSVTHLTEVVDQMQSMAHASAVVVVYDEENSLPDVIAASIDVPTVSVCVGDRDQYDLPSGTLVATNVVTAALSTAKILRSVSRVQSLQGPAAAPSSAPLEGVVVPSASLDEQIHDALEILKKETGVENTQPRRESNVVSSEVKSEASIELPSDVVY